MFQVENFKYNGFFVEHKKGIASYTATFKNWTNDPGIANCTCSDNKERLIPKHGIHSTSNGEVLLGMLRWMLFLISIKLL